MARGESTSRGARAKRKKRRAEGSGDAEPERRADEGRERLRPWSGPWLLEWAKTLAFAFAIFLVLRTFVIESFVITSGSMERTLLVGDFLLVNKTVFGSGVPLTPWRIPGYGEPERGEIVVFRSDHAPGLDLVKRMVAVPGDTLAMREGVLYLNGEAQEEPYLVHDPDVPDVHDPSMMWQREHLAPGVDPAGYRPTRDEWGPIVIPPERYFMLGDNREHSLDSRFWGLAERRKLKGKPFFVYYSYDREALKPFPFLLAARPGRLGLFPP